MRPARYQEQHRRSRNNRAHDADRCQPCIVLTCGEKRKKYRGDALAEPSTRTEQKRQRQIVRDLPIQMKEPMSKQRPNQRKYRRDRQTARDCQQQRARKKAARIVTFARL